MLAKGVNGNQSSQALTVTYKDGTTSSFTQSFSDWAHPQSFPGESIAVTMSHRDVSDGTTQTRTVDLYSYSFALNNSKTVSTIGLPGNANIEVLAITLVPECSWRFKTAISASLGSANVVSAEGIEPSTY